MYKLNEFLCKPNQVAKHQLDICELNLIDIHSVELQK